MILEINASESNIYIRCDDPKFSLSMYREYGEDYIGFSGEEAKRDMAIAVADAILRHM